MIYMPTKNPEIKKKIHRDYFKRHQARLQTERLTNTKHQAAKRRYTLRRYGLVDADYERLLHNQCGLCAICGIDSPGKGRKYFDVDHNHTTGVVRGLLCHVCNKYVGALENAKRTKAENYLFKFDPDSVSKIA